MPLRHAAMRRFFGMLLLSTTAAVSGCASREGVRIPATATTVAADQALILPPPGGPAIVSVVQHNYTNAIKQDIFLYTSSRVPGQNVLRTTFFGPVGLNYDDGRESLNFASLSDRNTRGEIRREFSGVAMSQSPYFIQNNYGPFGYASGRSASGDACIYAWQQIRSSDNARSAFQNRGTIQIKLRLCDAHSTPEQLLRVMYSFTVVGTFPAPGWNPFDAPPPTDAGLGRTGNPIYPGVPGSNVNQPPPAFQPQQPRPVAQASRLRAGAAAATSAPQPQPIAEPIGPAIPLPVLPGAPLAAAPAPVVVPTPGCAATGAGKPACK